MSERPRATLRTFGVILFLWGIMIAAVPLFFGPDAPPRDLLRRVPGRVVSVTPVAPSRFTEADLDIELLTTEGVVLVRAGFCQVPLAALDPGQPLTLWLAPYPGTGDVRTRAWQAEADGETLCALDESIAAAQRADLAIVLGGLAMAVLGFVSVVVSRIRPERGRRRDSRARRTPASRRGAVPAGPKPAGDAGDREGDAP
jgi:hypothetical protein